MTKNSPRLISTILFSLLFPSSKGSPTINCHSCHSKSTEETGVQPCEQSFLTFGEEPSYNGFCETIVVLEVREDELGVNSPRKRGSSLFDVDFSKVLEISRGAALEAWFFDDEKFDDGNEIDFSEILEITGRSSLAQISTSPQNPSPQNLKPGTTCQTTKAGLIKCKILCHQNFCNHQKNLTTFLTTFHENMNCYETDCGNSWFFERKIENCFLSENLLSDGHIYCRNDVVFESVLDGNGTESEESNFTKTLITRRSINVLDINEYYNFPDTSSICQSVIYGNLKQTRCSKKCIGEKCNKTITNPKSLCVKCSATLNSLDFENCLNLNGHANISKSYCDEGEDYCFSQVYYDKYENKPTAVVRGCARKEITVLDQVKCYDLTAAGYDMSKSNYDIICSQSCLGDTGRG